MAFIDDFLEMMPDTLVAQRVVLGLYGQEIPSGEAISVPCYIDETSRLVRDPRDGQQVVSSATIYVGGVYGLDAAHFVFTLPARFDPRTNRRAISVKPYSDENGPAYEVVVLP